MVGSSSDMLGPAVTVAHRLLKNTIRARIGSRPYLFLTDAAATALGLSPGRSRAREEYPDAGTNSRAASWSSANRYTRALRRRPAARVRLRLLRPLELRRAA